MCETTVLYLNNQGTRWIVLENGKRSTIDFETRNGRTVTRSPVFYEAFGNFAVVCINYKGKRIKVFPSEKLPD